MRQSETIEARRKIAEKVLVRMQERGFPIHNDPEFLTIVGDWISGEFRMAECRQRYLELLKTREDERKAHLTRPF